MTNALQKKKINVYKTSGLISILHVNKISSFLKKDKNKE